MKEDSDISLRIGRAMEESQQRIESSFFLGMVRCIEEMFDFSYSFTHKQFGQAIRTHPKGYVPFSLVFQQPHFIEKLRTSGLPPIEGPQIMKMGHCMHQWIQRVSKKLWSNPGNVRRIGRYNDQEITAVYVQNFPTANNHQAFEMLVSSKCTIFKIDYDDEYGFAWVYTNDPASLYELNGFQWHPKEKEKDEDYIYNLKVYTHEEVQKLETQPSAQDCTFQRIYMSKDSLMYPALEHHTLLQGHAQEQQSDDH